MNSVGDHSEVRELFDPSLCDDPDIEFAVAFGSRIRGTATAESDLDIALKFSDQLSASERFRKRCFLQGELQEPARPHIDLVDIETLPNDVARDVVAGELLCGDRARFERFRSSVEEQFESEHDQLRQRQQETIDRIAEEGLRG
jgi:predicted nucleotidyltransferase